MEPRHVLVGYVTRDGYTRVVAKAIAQRLRDAGLTVDLADLELSIRHAERYDAVVLACAAHHHKHALALAEWIEDHLDVLAARVTAFVSIEHGDHSEKLFARTAWRPGHVLVLDAAREPAMRHFLRELRGGPSQPHPDLDVARITAFADGLAPIIRSAAPRSDRGSGRAADGSVRSPGRARRSW